MAPVVAAAHGIGLAEASFGAEIVAFVVGLVVFSIGESAARSVWLNFAFVCAVGIAWVLSYGVAGSMGETALAANDIVPATLGAALLIAGVLTWRLKRSQWRRGKGEERAA